MGPKSHETNQKKTGSFLPLDYYNLEESDVNPEELMKRYLNE